MWYSFQRELMGAGSLPAYIRALSKNRPPAQGWLPELFPSLCDGISLPEHFPAVPVVSKCALSTPVSCKNGT